MVLNSTGQEIKTCAKSMVNTLLQSTLIEAASEGRLVSGLTQCTQVLQESEAHDLTACILPEEMMNSNFTLSIQRTLVEAICVEMGIPVIRLDVKESEPLRCHSFGHGQDNFKAEWSNAIIDINNNSAPAMDIECLLIQKGACTVPGYEKKLMDLLLSGDEEGGYAESPP